MTSSSGASFLRKASSAFIPFTDKRLRYGPVFRECLKTKADTIPKTRLRILSVDGGGVKGIMPAFILDQLEKELQEEVTRWQQAEEDPVSKQEDPAVESLRPILKAIKAKAKVGHNVVQGGNPKKLRIVDFFDVIGGTSTGGLIAAFLATKEPTAGDRVGQRQGPIRPAEELVSMYQELSRKVFPHRRYTLRNFLWRIGMALCCRPLLYNHTELETLLQKQLGSDTEAWETVRPCIMPTYDCDTNTPFIWETGIPIPGDDHVEEYGYKHARLWEVCRATSAAPTYLKPAQVTRWPLRDPNEKSRHNDDRDKVTTRYLDGGLYANDPVFFAYRWGPANLRHMDRLHLPDFDPGISHTLILSLGCGDVRNKVTKQTDQSKGPDEFRYHQWAQFLIDAAIEGTGQISHFGLFHPFAAAHRMPAYLRINPTIKADLERMDNANNLEKLIDAAKDYLASTGHKDYPGHLSRDPAGNEVNYIRSHLQQILASSYCGPNTRWDSVDSFIRTELLQETNGQQLARFAQILVWEWVIRRVRDAPFSVNG